MKNRPIIHIGSEDGDRLGLTAQFFSAGMVWDIRPKMFGIINLYPKEPATTAYEYLLRQLALTATPTEIVAPDAQLTEMALAQGWKKEVRPEGTPVIHNYSLKKPWASKQTQVSQQPAKQEPGKSGFSDAVLASLFDM